MYREDDLSYVTPQYEDLSGRIFGKLTVKERVVHPHKPITAQWICVCECGNVKKIFACNLLKEVARSCGCDRNNNRTKRHGQSQIPEYGAWARMRYRCLNTKASIYADYGGRGVGISKRWDKFETFLEDMGLRPSPKHSLDRINNDGNYEPSNCRWATTSEQAFNKRTRKAIQNYTDKEFIAEAKRRGLL